MDWLELLVRCLTEVVRIDIVALFLIMAGGEVLHFIVKYVVSSRFFRIRHVSDEGSHFYSEFVEITHQEWC